jgi:hypothetical protein
MEAPRDFTPDEWTQAVIAPYLLANTPKASLSVGYRWDDKRSEVQHAG